MSDIKLSKDELLFIKKALTHSANIYVYFFEQGAEGYPYEEVKEYQEKIINIIEKINYETDN